MLHVTARTRCPTAEMLCSHFTPRLQVASSLACSGKSLSWSRHMCHSHHSYVSSACPRSPGFEEVESPHGQSPMLPKNDGPHFPDGKWNLKRIRDDQTAESRHIADFEGMGAGDLPNHADDSCEAMATTPHGGHKSVFSPEAASRDGSKASQGAGGARPTARVLFAQQPGPPATVEGFLTSTERQVRKILQACSVSEFKIFCGGTVVSGHVRRNLQFCVPVTEP